MCLACFYREMINCKKKNTYSPKKVSECHGPFDYLFRFQVRFKCREVLLHKLEWKIIYMASAESEKYDQWCPSPATKLGQELILTGYSINNEYLDRELWEYPPLKPDFSQLHRNILSSSPHVICFHINWGGPADQMEDIGNVDPESEGRMPASCTPGKGRTPPSASCLRTPQTAWDLGRAQTQTGEPKDAATAWGGGSDWLRGGCVHIPTMMVSGETWACSSQNMKQR
ncbi:glycosyltransferase 8 domain-containing protein 2 [Platysternon megacephalum]|uniref:Glycosyltransferase 8 domain-containing protein 2 n=1 Tax=Platysternon megacephalum TaxID=55544 RepID=A0A4D9EDZ2_9SAUR|nr:glycosyltransferase 8 domain-containing protein 2 [Platysternon megacephalum]